MIPGGTPYKPRFMSAAKHVCGVSIYILTFRQHRQHSFSATFTPETVMFPMFAEMAQSANTANTANTNNGKVQG